MNILLSSLLAILLTANGYPPNTWQWWVAIVIANGMYVYGALKE